MSKSKIDIYHGGYWRRKDDHSRWARIDLFFRNRLGYETNLVDQMWCSIDQFTNIYESAPDSPPKEKGVISLNERHIWLLNYIDQADGGHVDVLNSKLVDSYILQFGMTFRAVIYGANKCPQLGKDLSKLHRFGILDRSSIGITSSYEDGWPKWVYSYKYSENNVGGVL